MPLIENTKAGKHLSCLRSGEDISLGRKEGIVVGRGKCGVFLGGGGANNDLFLDLDSGYIAMFIAHFEL